MSTYTPSAQLLAMLQHFEGLHDGDLKTIGLQPKLCPAGIWTEGWGHAIRDDKGQMVRADKPITHALAFSKVRTRAEADALLAQDVQKFADQVRRLFRRALPLHEFEALVSFQFNTGSLKLPSGKSSALLLAAQAADTNVVVFEFGRWVHAGGKKLKGLVWRRNAEANMYMGNNWRDALGPDRQHIPKK
jgi:lysozyme